MTVLVLTRHAESEWGARQLFTGWSDPPLSHQGAVQARVAGTRLAVSGTAIDLVYTSVLRRATQTASIMMGAAGMPSVPVVAEWRLNERHLGRLEGLTKAEVAATWGNEWRKRWRDDDLSRPPSLDPDDPSHPRHHPRYQHVATERLPGSERRCDTARRVLDFWHERVVADLMAGRNVLVVGHLGPLQILAGHLGHTAPGATPPVRWHNAETRRCQVAARRCCAQTTRPAAG